MKDFLKILSTARKTIRLEAESVEALCSYIDETFAEVVVKILESKGRLIVTGVGKSAHIAAKIVATLNSTGTPSLFMHATEAIHGDLGMIQKDDIVLCISRSGNTPEIKVLVPLLKRGDNTLIAMVAEKDSFLAEKSDYVLCAHIDREACPFNLAPTNSTIVQLAMGDALAMCLLEQRNFSPEDFAKYHPGGSLGKRMFLRVKDLMDDKKKPRVLAHQSISEVIFEISSKRLGATAVVSEKNELIGMITDGDLRRMLEKNRDISTICAEDIMTRTPKKISADELAVQAFQLMEEHSITQLVVCSESEYLGMIHLHDLLKEGIV